ncbi:RING finger protein B [Lucilia cuprina]|uniref:RING finger protein B n=1 Tax=Lucilia cuprina TaxID=7375 RepID=UPI001F05CA66|nr:RING finger protein B [Lucilia cuprina]
MPCEGCHVQFTVFKRKRSCYDCKRYYCHNCLASSSNNNRKHALCERCLLFSKRPLGRSDLTKLKSKDLIFYLQSKHISTAGCVEKEELIELVLQYVNRTDMNSQTFSGGSGSSSGSSSHHTTPQHNGNGGGIEDSGRPSTDYGPSANNSFDSIKQTCQNFFSNLSDNISDSLANLESRACSKNRPPTTMTTTTTNVTEQPRVTTRVIPTYASSQQNSPENPLTSPIAERRQGAETTYTAESLVVNLPPSVPESTENNGHVNMQDECNCSDDEEMIASFNGRTRSPKSEQESHNLSLNKDEHDSVNVISNNCAPSTSTSTSKAPSQYSKLEIYVNDEESSHSSFEELGAIGGISDDSKTTTDTTSNTTDHWQMLDLKANETEPAQHQQQQQQTQQYQESPLENLTSNEDINKAEEHTVQSNNSQQTHYHHPPPTPTHVHPAPRVKKVTRRRSESYLNRRRPQTSVEDDEDDDVNHVLQNARIEEEIQTTSSTSAAIRKTTTKRCCTRCGKNKANIRQQVEKMRQHLESSQMSESDIKQELSEFLAYLEQRTKSIEYSDSEAGISTPSVSRHTNEIEEEEEISVERPVDDHVESERNVDQSESTTAHFYDKDSRFINLDEIESMKQLECLTVKQLKEILMLHRVDYKGCCEKQELLDRVERLWKNLKSTPAVEKLPTDELCKICMDAPIECVILECGHMATCTNCGKVLSECPICRQYIVRVVRFFRA